MVSGRSSVHGDGAVTAKVVGPAEFHAVEPAVTVMEVQSVPFQ